MSLPDCLGLPSAAELSLKIRFPGGVEIAALHSEVSKLQNSCSMSLNLLKAVQPIMVPLKPIFDIIDTLSAVLNCITAVPKAIIELDPSEITGCLEELGIRVGALLELLPSMSVPLMLLDIFDMLITFLSCLVAQMEDLVSQLEDVAHRAARADIIGDGNLRELVRCKEDDVRSIQANADDALRALGTIFAMINTMLGLLGMEPMPDVNDLVPAGAVEPIETIGHIRTGIEKLQEIRAMIPIP